MASGVDFRTVSFYLSRRVAIMCSLKKDSPRSTLMAKFSTAVNSTLVSTLYILTCSVMLTLVLSPSFEADKGDGSIPVSGQKVF